MVAAVIKYIDSALTVSLLRKPILGEGDGTKNRIAKRSIINQFHEV